MFQTILKTYSKYPTWTPRHPRRGVLGRVFGIFFQNSLNTIDVFVRIIGNVHIYVFQNHMSAGFSQNQDSLRDTRWHPCTTNLAHNVAVDASKVARPAAGSIISGGNGNENEVYITELDNDEAMQREFMMVASRLSESELRQFVLEHVTTELAGIRALPLEQRPHAFRMLLVDWHPDKCPPSLF